MLRDYVRWLEHYDDPGSPLSWRLGQAQAWLRRDLDSRAGSVGVVSMCAGDGRDIVDVLGERDDRDRVRVVLLEVDPVVAQLARDRAAALGLTGVEVRTADAADTGSYVDAVPADIVLLVGVFGNISTEDLARTIVTAPQFCAPGATLIWSRGRERDDLNDLARTGFDRAGFAELEYVEADLGTRPALGLLRYDGPPTPLETGQHLFTFWR